jgi:hypothetical protein
MLMIERDDVFSKFLNLLMKIADFRLILFSGLNQYKIVS